MVVSEAARYARVKALFLEVCELPLEQQQDWLSASGAEPELLLQVRRMLQAEPAHTQDFDRPVVGMLADLAGAELLQPGARLGAWTLIRKIGEGGMGSVYLAQRSDGHFEQTAAIKLLHGLPSPAALAFLARERQILASLAHPNIARLLDGGATPLGQPYLVMEFLDGAIPIDQYCRLHALPTARMLDLLMAVCSAVSFAHSRLVVHCDLKPGNILVDALGRPLLLDFGIARLLVNEHTEGELASTSVQARAFTPGYASPEQERGDPVSTLSDVYSLGHLLADLLRAQPGGAGPELQAIVRCATQSEPLARYASVAALAEDLQRYLAREPLQAMPPSWWYRTRKLLQRRWAVVAVIGTFLLTISAFTLQLVADRDRALAAERRAISERDRATQAEASAQQISHFLGNILSSVDPDNAKSMDRSLMRSLLDQAAVKARNELQSNPLVLRQIETVVADSYRAISDFPVAVEHYDAALRTFESVTTDPALRAAEEQSRMELSDRRIVALIDAGDTELAGQLLDPLITLSEQQSGALAEITLRLKSRKAQLLFKRGDLKAALQSAQQTQQLFERSGIRAAAAWLYQLNILGILESNDRQYASAQTHMQQAIKIATQTYGPLHSTTLRSRHSLAVLLIQSRRMAEAVELLKPLLVDTERALGTGHLLTISTLSNLGTALRQAGNLSASAPYYQQAYERALQRFGANHPLTLDLANNLALYEIAAGKAESALQRMGGVLALSQQIHGRLHPSLVEALRTHAKALTALKRMPEARVAWTDVIARDRELYGEDDSTTIADQRALTGLND